MNKIEKRTDIPIDPRKGDGHIKGNDPIIPIPKIDPNKPSNTLERTKK